MSRSDGIGALVLAAALLMLAAGWVDARSRGRGLQRGQGGAGWLVWNFASGAPLSTQRLLRGSGSARRAGVRLAAVAGPVGVLAINAAAGPIAAASAVVAAAIVAMGVWAAVRRVGRWLRRQGMWADAAWGWLVWNFATGAPVRVGPALQDQTGRWEIAVARARVAVPRLIAVGVGGGVVYRLAGAPLGEGLAVTFGVGLVAPLIVAAAVWLAVKGLLAWGHYRRWLLPLHHALHPVVGYPLEFSPRRYLVVPRDKAEGAGGVLVGVPPTFDYSDKKRERVEDLTRRKLALDDVTTNWVSSSSHGYLQLRPRAHAPATALFGETKVRELVERAKASAPLIGLTVGDEPVAFDLDSEAPHLLWSAGTGGGKSSLIRAMAAQLMHHGAHVVVIDLKRHSQPWLRGLPGVTYVRDAEDIHDTFIWLAGEGDRRNRAWDNVPLGEQGPRFPRLVVICEELNATFSKLRRHWSTIRPSGAPQLSPAVEGFQDLLFMGRAVQINVLAVAQMATAKDLGGPEARENFIARVLARYTPNAWKMLVPEIPYRPASTVPGRVMVCRSGQATETQAVFFTDLEARDWASSGRQAAAVDLRVSQGDRTPDLQGKDPGTVPASAPVPASPPTLTVIDGGNGRRGVTLAEASADRGEGIVPERWETLRKGSRRDPEFPKPIGTRTVKGGEADVFDPDALAFWHRNRPGTKGVRS